MFLDEFGSQNLEILPEPKKDDESEGEEMDFGAEDTQQEVIQDGKSD